MALSKRDLERIDERIELGVRRYFDHYLTDIFPEQVKAIRADSAQIVAAHNDAREAHGGALQTLLKFRWIVMGFAIGGGFGAGVGFDALLKFL